MADRFDVFLSYSHADREPAIGLRGQLERHGLAVFRDHDRIRAGDLWLNGLQDAVAACGSFVVLVGRDGVARWIGAETQAALNRYFGPRDDAERLPIFPILLGETDPASLPVFLKLFQATSWNGVDPLPETVLEQIRARTLVPSKVTFEGCPFVGLEAYRPDQANLFFGRQKETLDALACFDPRPGNPDRPHGDEQAPIILWLEISGNSGSGKSSLMNAGLLPLVDQGWLWPRTGFAHWQRIGPMMPGERPVAMLAEHLARALGGEMSEVRRLLEADERALCEWLRGRKPDDQTAFLLAIDQFEELFTFADPQERGRFDRLLATALADPACPLFVVSTVRTDFLDRFDEALPQLVPVRNRSGKLWTLPLIDADALREVVSGPARLAGLDASEVQEAIVVEAQGEPGALPLVETALRWLWEHRSPDGRLSGRLFSGRGGLAGILSEGADGLLASLGKQRGRALELLFRLVTIDPEGRRHTHRPLELAQAVAVAGGGAEGQALIDRLAGARARDDPRARRPLRLITVTGDTEGRTAAEDEDEWVSLIHETLIRSKGPGPDGKPQPYWPTLWNYIEQHKDRAARRERLQLLAREWKDRRGLARLVGLAGWLALFRFRGLADPGSIEQRYLRWSLARSLAQALVLVMIAGVVGESWVWMGKYDYSTKTLTNRWAYRLGRELPLPELERVPPEDWAPGAGHGQAVQAFYLGSTEVTFREWEACYESGGCTYEPSDEGWGRGQQPVIDVNAYDAHDYVRWLSAMTGVRCRLPSDAEWEDACRAGTTAAYALPAPDGGDTIAGLANCEGCGGAWDERDRAAPVKQYGPNAWGLYDMHGNVWEWVASCGDENAGQAATRCQVDALRGGYWGQENARCGFGVKYRPNRRFNGVGFRVLCEEPINQP